MSSIISLSTICEHTLTEILNHGNKTEMGIIMRSCVKHNSLEDMSDLLIYDLNDFTTGGTLCRYKETAEAEETKLLPNTPLKELHNLYRYIQHLILESKFDYYDEACQEFRGQVVPQIEAVHNLRKVRMYLNVLSLRSTS